MKEQWLKLAAKIEALSLRERAMVALASAAAVVFVVYITVLDPAYMRQKALTAMISQQRLQIAGIDVELTQKEVIARVDPDLPTKQKLAKLKVDNEAMRNTLRTMQKGLVAPDKIVQLLEQILHGNSKLRLVSLKTLAPRGMSDGRFSEPDEPAEARPEANKAVNFSLLPAPAVAAPAAPPAAPRAPVKQEELLYRHGVQIVVQGGYMEMVKYMEALEHMPAQLFWGNATLNAEAYPNASLTLTLYTLSLDQQWIAL
ncbi:MAG: hypothetical protein V4724_03650 [Pseudomonadota bacterium]